MAQVIDRKELHDLIDEMTPEQVRTANNVLRSIIADDFDDEPLTDEDIQRLKETKAALERGERGTPMEEVLADFGLTMDDFPLKK
jgi:hypothetical protein